MKFLAASSLGAHFASRSAKGFAATTSSSLFCLLDQLRHALAHGFQHRAVIEQHRLVGDQAVARHDPALVIAEFPVEIGGRNHALDVAAIGEVDVRIAFIGEGVAGC